MEAQLKESPIAELIESARKKSVGTSELIQRTHTEELVFALCGPIGSPLHAVGVKLKEILSRFGYETQIIRLSKFISEKGKSVPDRATPFVRINHLIEQGNEIRAAHGNGVLAELGIAEIHFSRQQQQGEDFKNRRVCHIFDSIKNKEELEVLRLVYGNLFYCIGVFCSAKQRKEALKQCGLVPWEIEKLIDRDSGEEIANGQTVRDTFPRSDYFMKLQSESDTELENQIVRFVHLITKAKIVTPTQDENAMYVAASAAVNSACLSRQVGAAVTDSEGNLLGMGWNEVPRPGGGVYGDINASLPAQADMRCMEWGKHCFNQIEKQKLAASIVDALVDLKIVPKTRTDEAVSALLDSKIKDLIEFSRAVHAEVHAIIKAAQNAGPQMKNGRLYCTTYPCHSCARHIVVAGIKTIFFIEPYRKSLALHLHGDSLSEDEKETEKVRLIPYAGVAPRRHHEFFQARKDRKDSTGTLTISPFSSAKPSTGASLESFPYLEMLVLDQLVTKSLIQASAPNPNATAS